MIINWLSDYFLITGSPGGKNINFQIYFTGISWVKNFSKVTKSVFSLFFWKVPIILFLHL